jgi:tetratricopeptide (TPR) repeat protein
VSAAYLHHALAVACLSCGELSEAREHFASATSNPAAPVPNAYHAWSRLESREGRYREAAKLLKKGLRLSPENHRLHHELGQLSRRAGNYEAALEYLLRGQSLAPPHARCFFDTALAVAHYETGDLPAARESAGAAVRSNPQHAQGWIAAARIEELEANVLGAKRYYALATAGYEQRRRRGRGGTGAGKGDKWAHVYQSHARFLQSAGDAAGAKRVYGTATALFDGSWRLWTAWGKLEADGGESLKARTILGEAAKRAGGASADPHRSAGELEMDLLQYERARGLFFKGAEAVKNRPGRCVGASERAGGVSTRRRVR